ncbi:COPII coat complex component secretory 24CD isoform X2 [Dermacentor variabilis]|uniref:COPII coat complex component secretory 24CD isoform X2 n=1 Tax=Dermacentor variabilis TaxID=34621 RepID=UPI003F5C38B4
MNPPQLGGGTVYGGQPFGEPHMQQPGPPAFPQGPPAPFMASAAKAYNGVDGYAAGAASVAGGLPLGIPPPKMGMGPPHGVYTGPPQPQQLPPHMHQQQSQPLPPQHSQQQLPPPLHQHVPHMHQQQPQLQQPQFQQQQQQPGPPPKGMPFQQPGQFAPRQVNPQEPPGVQRAPMQAPPMQAPPMQPPPMQGPPPAAGQRPPMAATPDQLSNQMGNLQLSRRPPQPMGPRQPMTQQPPYPYSSPPGGAPPPTQFYSPGGVPPQGTQANGPGSLGPPPGAGYGAPPGVQMPAAHPTMTAPPPPQQQQQRKLDPDQMPSPGQQSAPFSKLPCHIQVIEDDRKAHSGPFYTNKRGLVPPLVTTDFIVHDEGICSPRFVRSTIYSVPCTPEMLRQTALPFALCISPFARQAPGESALPLSDFGEEGPVRCNRCKAYMCPLMQFIDGGRRFQCVFCKATTEVPPSYFAHLDHLGQRSDKFQRPELCLGSYEIVATKEYCKNSVFPEPPAYLFLLDVSYNSIRNGLVRLFCSHIQTILQELPRAEGETESKVRVGFITYSSVVHFYNLKASLAQPQMLVVPDVHDMFVPLLDGCLVTVQEASSLIDSLLEQIPVMFGETRETETILGAAIQAGLEALKAAECAGKLFVMHTSLPIADAPGKLKNRDDRKLLGTDKEKSVLTPQSPFYNQLGQECVAAGCCVDLFLFHNAYVDVATVGQVAKMTGGQVYKYTYFQSTGDKAIVQRESNVQGLQEDVEGARFLEDLRRDISQPTAFDAVMRVRTSTGIRPTDFYGNYYMANTTDVELAAVDCNKCIAVEIKYDDKLSEEEGAFVQVALLYTTFGGQRRLRIHNLALATCSQMADMYRNCDLDTIVNVLSKQAIRQLLEQSPRQVRDGCIGRGAQMLAAYRKHCASPSSSGQLILPECMKLLPLYLNCLLKSDALSGGPEMTTDDRSFAMLSLCSMDVASTVAYFYPRLLPLHDVDVDSMELPVALRCTAEKIQEDGCYLLENGIHMFLWIGMAVDPDFLQNVFAQPVAARIDIDKTSLLELNTPISRRVRDIIDRIRMERQRCMRLTLVRQGDKMELVFRQFLVEDRHGDSGPSYVDFLCHLHKEIRNLLS